MRLDFMIYYTYGMLNLCIWSLYCATSPSKYFTVLWWSSAFLALITSCLVTISSILYSSSFLSLLSPSTNFSYIFSSASFLDSMLLSLSCSTSLTFDNSRMIKSRDLSASPTVALSKLFSSLKRYRSFWLTSYSFLVFSSYSVNTCS